MIHSHMVRNSLIRCTDSGTRFVTFEEFGMWGGILSRYVMDSLYGLIIMLEFVCKH